MTGNVEKTRWGETMTDSRDDAIDFLQSLPHPNLSVSPIISCALPPAVWLAGISTLA